MLSLGEACALLSDAVLSGPAERRFLDVSTDTRSIKPGDLFVALSGEHFDGHRFVGAALEKGAVAALVEHPVPVDLPTIQIPDARRALGELARGWRSRFRIPLIVVVGSNGKTTTKEMLASILAAEFGEEGRLATRGTLNNEIGVPLTLLRLRTAHRAAVLELGMNHPGETRWLAEMAQPTVALVTNAQREHQEFMKSVAAVALEHAEAIGVLPHHGVAVFPANDAQVEVWRAAAGTCRSIEFALEDQKAAPLPGVASSGPDVRGVAHLAPFDTVVHIDTPSGALTAKLATAGLHNAQNATAAAAAACAARVSLDAVRRGLESFAPVAQRMQRRTLETGGLLIDDSYNANPDSVRAAIGVLGTLPGPTLLILGDMGELGENAEPFHAEVGAYARTRGVTALYATGPLTRFATDAFGEGSAHFEDAAEVIAATRQWLLEPDHDKAIVLVKGSRFMAMEKVVQALAPQDPPAASPGTH